MRKVIAYDYWTAGARLHVVCPACFQRAVDNGMIWRASPKSPWLDAVDGNAIGVYMIGEKPPRPQCDDCGRALE
jgi:hypothetical protein